GGPQHRDNAERHALAAFITFLDPATVAELLPSLGGGGTGRGGRLSGQLRLVTCDQGGQELRGGGSAKPVAEKCQRRFQSEGLGGIARRCWRFVLISTHLCQAVERIA